MRSTTFLSALGFVAVVGVPAAQAQAGTPAPAQAPRPAPAETRQASAVDDTLEDRIEYRIETNAVTRKYNVDVDVVGGVATLSGEVATAAQKAEAARLAQIDGVRRVENTIEIDANADKTLADRTKAGLNKAGEAINDAWITTKVKWFIAGDDLLDNSEVNVDTNANVVTLKGTVPSAAAKARAEQLAKDTEGVSRVVSELTVAAR
jgi:osmotically-inducible protein OsmY